MNPTGDNAAPACIDRGSRRRGLGGSLISSDSIVKPNAAIAFALRLRTDSIGSYIFVKLECEPAPLVLGFILGPMMEENLRRAMLRSRGDATVFVTEPISIDHAMSYNRILCTDVS